MWTVSVLSTHPCLFGPCMSRCNKKRRPWQTRYQFYLSHHFSRLVLSFYCWPYVKDCISNINRRAIVIRMYSCRLYTMYIIYIYICMNLIFIRYTMAKSILISAYLQCDIPLNFAAESPGPADASAAGSVSAKNRCLLSLTWWNTRDMQIWLP